MDGGLKALEQKRLESLGPLRNAQLDPIMSDKEQGLIDKIRNWKPKSMQQQTPQQGVPGQAPATGGVNWERGPDGRPRPTIQQ